MGKVYAYIGVIGSGKDYASERKAAELNCEIFDFSGGVRDFTFNFLGWKPQTPKDYVYFKSEPQTLYFRHDGVVNRLVVTGRKFLENVGFTMRSYDPNFWVNYCKARATTYIEEGNDNVVFNAVRYVNEANAVKNVAFSNELELHFIFTDYRSGRYEVRNDDSELFAQSILAAGFKHGDDITDYVLELIRQDFFDKHVTKK